MHHRGDVVTPMPSRDMTSLDNLVERIFDKFQNIIMRVCQHKDQYKGD
jgi:hypothetical protein